MTVPAPRPPIPATRQGIADEAKRCVNTRADHQQRLINELVAIDALTLRLEDLVEALREAPA